MEAVFTNEENTQIKWTNEQGQVWSVPYPLVDGEIPRAVQEWLDQGNSIVPYVTPTPTKEQLRSALADKRWRVETGGITWNGSPLSTDDRAKTLISGAASAMADGDTFKFKVAAGVWIDITGIQVRAMRDAITAHVQACFDKEAELDADITSGTITTLDQIEAAAWPANS